MEKIVKLLINKGYKPRFIDYSKNSEDSYLEMALTIKWIRENFKIEIALAPIRINNPRRKAYQFVIISNNYNNFEQLGDFDSPEEAIEAAFLYTLQNLIP